MTLYITAVMSLIVLELSPPKNPKWYHPFTYIVTWPIHFGQWIKNNFEKEKDE